MHHQRMIRLTVLIHESERIETPIGEMKGFAWLERFKRQITKYDDRRAEVRITGSYGSVWGDPA